MEEAGILVIGSILFVAGLWLFVRLFFSLWNSTVPQVFGWKPFANLWMTFRFLVIVFLLGAIFTGPLEFNDMKRERQQMRKELQQRGEIHK